MTLKSSILYTLLSFTVPVLFLHEFTIDFMVLVNRIYSKV